MTMTLPASQPHTCPSRALLPLKLWYLFYFAAQFTQLFLPLILNSVLKFSPSSIGLLMGARRFIIFIGAPLFTYLCDKTFRHRSLLTIAHIAYYICTLLLSRTRSFGATMVVIIMRELFISGCEPTVNNAAMATLDDVGDGGTGYGVLRLWGSLGWGIASLIGPFISDTLFNGDLLAILYTQVAFGIVVVYLVASKLNLSRELFERQSRRRQLQGAATMVHTVLRSPRVMYCMLTVLLQGVVLGVFQMTVFLYFSALGVSTTALGISVLLSCGAEAISFMYDTEFWRRFGGAYAGFQYGLIMSSVTMICYCVVQFSPSRSAAFVVVEVMNGGTYALFLTSALQIAKQLAPVGMSSTAQGVLSALFYGVGPALGSLFSGVAYERLGAPVIYCAMAALQLAVLAVPVVFGLKLEGDCDGGDGEQVRDGERLPLVPTRLMKMRDGAQTV